MSKALLLAVLVGLSGCTSYELTRVRNDIARTPGVEVGEGYAVAFGRLSVGTVRTGLRFGDDDDAAALRAALGHVRKAQVARYRLDAAPPLAEMPTPGVVDRYVRDGWTPAVAARDDDAAVWLLARDSRRGELRDLLLVTLLPTELIVAKLSGNLTEAVGAFARQADVTQLGDLFGRGAAPPDSARVDE